MPRVEAVLFDLDGTLVDSAPDFLEVVNSLRKEDSLPPLAYEKIREQVSNGGVALSCLTWEITPEHSEIMAYRERLLTRYSEVIGSQAKLFNGFEDVLAKLQAHDIQWGIVTNKPKPYALPLLSKLQIDSPVVICPEDVIQRKPHPEPLHKAANLLGVTAQNCWYVGDHARDIESAIAASMTSVAALFGYIEPQINPQDWNADHYIHQPQDLLSLLNL